MLANKTLLHLALIILLGFLVYSNTFDVPFIFDDQSVIVDNPGIRNISNIPSMFINMEGPWASRPLLHATNAFNYYFGGLDTRGYHAMNLALHLLNGILLYLLVRITGGLMDYGERGIRLVALTSAMIFVLHPMQTESVTYIGSRSMLLSTCLFFSGILLFVRAVISEKQRGIYMAGLFTVSLLGMSSRENFATFPAVLFLYDLFFISRFKLRETASHYKVHLIVLMSLGYMVYLVLKNTYVPSGNSLPGDDGLPHPEYVLTQFKVHWTYIRLLVFPFNQSIDHDYPVAKALFELPTLISFLGYIGLLSFGLIYAKKWSVAAFGILWFLLILLPISFLVAFLDLRLNDVILEHRVYLPSAGIIVAGVTSVALQAGKTGSSRVTTAAVVCAVFSTLALGSATYARNSVWQSNMSIWEDVVNKSPKKWRGYYNLADEYREANLLEKGIEQYKVAIRLNPDHASSYYNLGLSYKRLGLDDMALEQYFLALRRDPNLIETYYNVGNVYLERELYDKAIDYYKTYLNLNPDSAEAHYNMGIAFYYKELYEQAVEHYRASLDLNPDEAEAHNNLGVAYLKLGKKKLALREVKEAIRLDPGLIEARETLEEIMETSETVPEKVR